MGQGPASSAGKRPRLARPSLRKSQNGVPVRTQTAQTVGHNPSSTVCLTHSPGPNSASDNKSEEKNVNQLTRQLFGPKLLTEIQNRARELETERRQADKVLSDKVALEVQVKDLESQLQNLNDIQRLVATEAARLRERQTPLTPASSRIVNGHEQGKHDRHA